MAARTYQRNKSMASIVKAMVLLSLLFTQWALADVVDVRLWAEPNLETTVVLDLTRAHDHQAFYLSSPERVVLDVQAAQMLKSVSEVDLMGGPVRSIRSARRNSNDVRVVLELKQGMDYKTYSLAPNEVHGHRLVVKLAPKQQLGKTMVSPTGEIKKAEDYTSKTRDIIIAIDAGHGGEDPGAIGPRGIREKDVVLAIAKELEKILKAAPGYSPLMIRTGDYYLNLRERASRAENAKAELFISIHADAFKHPSASGGSVYALSEHGASSTTAKWLADKENRSDTIGGVDLGNITDDVRQVILDLSMTHKQKESLPLGLEVLRSMGKITKLHKHNVEEAGFAVLKGASAYALLVETGFISNPQEAKQLANPAFQRKMAQAIFDGINTYYSAHPPDGSLLAKNKKNKPIVYFVKPGDTLSQIARQYQVELQEVRQLNNLNRDILNVGQQLLIPKS